MASKNVETFRTAHQAFNARNFDAVVGVMVEGVTYQDQARGITFRGRDGFKGFMQAWVTAFSNATVTEPVYIDGGDIVVCQFIGTGVNDGPLGPLSPSGKAMKLPFCEYLRFNDKGEAVSGGCYYDQLSMLTQLGHAQPQQTGKGAD
jgi:hypothetical protein